MIEKSCIHWFTAQVATMAMTGEGQSQKLEISSRSPRFRNILGHFLLSPVHLQAARLEAARTQLDAGTEGGGLIPYATTLPLEGTVQQI